MIRARFPRRSRLRPATDVSPKREFGHQDAAFRDVCLPDGRTVLLKALAKDLQRDQRTGEGDPPDTTSSTISANIHPSFSRDGRSVVFVSWDDAALADESTGFN